MKCALSGEGKGYYVKSDQPNPTLYFSSLNQYAQELKERGKGIVFVGKSFIMGTLGDPASLDLGALEGAAKEMSKKGVKTKSSDQVVYDKKEKGVPKVTTKGIKNFSMTGDDIKEEVIAKVLEEAGFVEV